MSKLTIEKVFEIIDSELEKRKEHTFLLWDFPNDVKKRIEELDNKKSNLEQELGCPLEVVFKAFEKGIIFHREEYDVIIDGEYITIVWETKELKWNNAKGRAYLKDYKKTWWLKGDMDNEKD